MELYGLHSLNLKSLKFLQGGLQRRVTVIVIFFTGTLFHLFVPFFLSIVDDDEEEKEIRIVKRVEDYYPEDKFTARYTDMKGFRSHMCFTEY